MKRVHLVSVLLVACIGFWVLLYPLFQSTLFWLLVPVLAVGGVGVYSLASILKSVFMLRDYPEEQQSLHYDIGRARQFYKDRGFAL